MAERVYAARSEVRGSCFCCDPVRNRKVRLFAVESYARASLVKIHRKGQMTLPARLRALAGIGEGDFVEAAFLSGKIVITPKVRDLEVEETRFAEFTR